MDLTINLSTHAALGLFLAVAMMPAMLALSFHLMTKDAE